MSHRSPRRPHICLTMHVPPEILHKIFRDATVVPEAFDTSFDAVLCEDREAVFKAIQTSMIAKTSLSLVSKLFHCIVEEFLYEIVSIRQLIHLPLLSKNLRNQTTYGWRTTKPHGQQCRRLEICLGTYASKDTAWYEGGHTLWGLIAACPNINILLCRIWAKGTRSQGAITRRVSTLPHLTDVSLWKLIASTCGPHLRRIEFFGFSIRMDRVEMMLRYCTMLEVCCLVHVRPYSDEEQIYDSEEPASIKIPLFNGPHIVSDRTPGRPSQLFDPLARREFENAKTNTSWPTCSLKPPYTLPSLHTFHIDRFNPRISQLNMPTLRHLGLYGGEETGMAECIFTSCSSFLDTLTHLSIGDDTVPLELILNAFPHITELCFHYAWDDSAVPTVTNPHTSLSVVKYICHDSIENMAYHIGDLLSVTESGMLPALREVLVVHWEGKGQNDENLPVEKFRILGVALGMKSVKPFGQYQIKGVLCFPDYLYYQ
jgi:hypothetical protein